MKLRLILANVGTLTGARVINAETGEELEDLVNVKYEHRAGQLPTLTIEVRETDVSLVEPGDGLGE